MERERRRLRVPHRRQQRRLAQPGRHDRPRPRVGHGGRGRRRGHDDDGRGIAERLEVLPPLDLPAPTLAEVVPPLAPNGERNARPRQQPRDAADMRRRNTPRHKQLGRHVRHVRRRRPRPHERLRRGEGVQQRRRLLDLRRKPLPQRPLARILLDRRRRRGVGQVGQQHDAARRFTANRRRPRRDRHTRRRPPGRPPTRRPTRIRQHHRVATARELHRRPRRRHPRHPRHVRVNRSGQIAPQHVRRDDAALARDRDRQRRCRPRVIDVYSRVAHRRHRFSRLLLRPRNPPPQRLPRIAPETEGAARHDGHGPSLDRRPRRHVGRRLRPCPPRRPQRRGRRLHPLRRIVVGRAEQVARHDQPRLAHDELDQGGLRRRRKIIGFGGDDVQPPGGQRLGGVHAPQCPRERVDAGKERHQRPRRPEAVEQRRHLPAVHRGEQEQARHARVGLGDERLGHAPRQPRAGEPAAADLRRQRPIAAEEPVGRGPLALPNARGQRRGTNGGEVARQVAAGEGVGGERGGGKGHF